MNYAPIALFVYNRLQHTRQTVAALARNELAADSTLLVFSDGPKSDADANHVREVREFAASISGFKSVTVIERDANLGCAQSVITGVTEIVNAFGRIIVVEDDIVTAPFFLTFMNQGLEFYQNEEKVACIHGYLYPVRRKLPETFFIRGADIWGWGTWKRGWELYEPDAQKLLFQLEEKGLCNEFNFNGAYDFTQMLRDQIDGRLNTWDIQWYASAFLKGKLTLYPGRSLVRNIGYDGSGTHCDSTNIYDTKLSNVPVKITSIPVEESVKGKNAVGRFHKYPRGGPFKEFIVKVAGKLESLNS